ncbi:MAG: hypothetical protein H0X62_07675, partial [Bacteroidetes bacterium]|nr:hypothetical protein [Bacteroidota bacterium]
MKTSYYILAILLFIFPALDSFSQKIINEHQSISIFTHIPASGDEPEKYTSKLSNGYLHYSEGQLIFISYPSKKEGKREVKETGTPSIIVMEPENSKDIIVIPGEPASAKIRRIISGNNQLMNSYNSIKLYNTKTGEEAELNCHENHVLLNSSTGMEFKILHDGEIIQNGLNSEIISKSFSLSIQGAA